MSVISASFSAFHNLSLEVSSNATKTTLKPRTRARAASPSVLDSCDSLLSTQNLHASACFCNEFLEGGGHLKQSNWSSFEERIVSNIPKQGTKPRCPFSVFSPSFVSFMSFLPAYLAASLPVPVTSHEVPRIPNSKKPLPTSNDKIKHLSSFPNAPTPNKWTRTWSTTKKKRPQPQPL